MLDDQADIESLWDNIAQRDDEINDLTSALDAAQDEIRELTRQRDDARDIVARSGYFIDCNSGCVMWHSTRDEHRGSAEDGRKPTNRPEQPMPLVDPDGLLFGGGS